MAIPDCAARAGRYRMLRRSAASVALFCLAFAGAVHAECLDLNLQGVRSATPSPRFIPAAYQTDENAGNAVEGAAIVGMWKFEWRAKGNAGVPDGALLDFGTILWHEDGTEITVSGGRTPAVGDVCMGAWRQVGRSTFNLTHLAMGYGSPPGPVTGYGGLTTLQMQVTVSADGDAYFGYFTLTQHGLKFDPNVPFSEFDESEKAFALTGTVTAKRISPK